MRFTKEDYIIILKHYGYKIPTTKGGKPDLKKMKKRANSILAGKLCRCIKSVQKSKYRKYAETVAIAICNKSIFRNRGFKHYRFTCKKKHKLYPKKGTRTTFSKTRKGKLKFRPKRTRRRK